MKKLKTIFFLKLLLLPFLLFSSSPYQNIKLSIAANNNQTFTQIFYIDGTTTGFDNGYDSSVFGGATSSFQIYTQHVSGDTSMDLAIQSLPKENFENMIIPVGLIAPSNTEITFSIITEHFPSDLKVYLEDRTNNTFINLSETNYTFTPSNALNGTGQFYIHTSTINPSYFIWQGIDTDWNNTLNWNKTQAPTSGSNIYIPNDVNQYPTLNNASITLNDIYIESDASFIATGNVNGTVSFNKDILNTNWHFISSPVSGEIFSDFNASHTLASGSGDNIGFAPYNTSSNSWNYYTNATTANLNIGEGYSLKLTEAGTINFIGNINTSNISYPLSAAGSGYNLLGNPFIAYFNSGLFLTENSTNLTEETIWTWDGSQYVAHPSGDAYLLSPGEGFFVKANTNNTINFNTSYESHNTTSSKSNNESFIINIDNGISVRSTKVSYETNKTIGFDNGYDAGMFDGTLYNLAIYTALIEDYNSKKLAIQSLPTEQKESIEIPVGIIAKANETITFSINSNTLHKNLSIYLEDKNSNQLTDLTKTDYTVTLTSDSHGIGNFYITVSNKSLNTTDVKLNNISIYKNSNSQIIISGIQEKTSVDIFSLSGIKVHHTTVDANISNTMVIPKLSTGIYVVRLVSENGNKSQKIIID